MRARTAAQLRILAMHILAASVIPIELAACAGAVADNPEAGSVPGDGSDVTDTTLRDASTAVDATVGDVDWYAPDACRPASPPMPPAACATYVVAVTGDPATCSDCIALCGQAIPCRFDSDAGTVSCVPMCPVEAGWVDGRRPPQLLNEPSSVHNPGGHFARMAFYEAASVEAFGLLERELRAHGAPRALLDSLARARRDEVRHAQLASALARRFGESTVAPRVGPLPLVRGLFEIALENAREGCGRELVGAAIGLHQAEKATDPDVRAFYAEIARDELRHAALAMRLHAWLAPQLTRAQRARVEREWRDALELNHSADDGDARLGIPASAQRARIAASLSAALS